MTVKRYIWEKMNKRKDITTPALSFNSPFEKGNSESKPNPSLVT